MLFRANVFACCHFLEAPDLARDKVRHIERVARGAASEDEVASVLGVLIELLEMACDEQVVLLVDGYDAAWLGRAIARALPAPIRQGYLTVCCLTPLLPRAIRYALHV